MQIQCPCGAAMVLWSFADGLEFYINYAIINSHKGLPTWQSGLKKKIHLPMWEMQVQSLG